MAENNQNMKLIDFWKKLSINIAKLDCFTEYFEAKELNLFKKKNEGTRKTIQIITLNEGSIGLSWEFGPIFEKEPYSDFHFDMNLNWGTIPKDSQDLIKRRFKEFLNEKIDIIKSKVSNIKYKGNILDEDSVEILEYSNCIYIRIAKYQFPNNQQLSILELESNINILEECIKWSIIITKKLFDNISDIAAQFRKFK